MPRKERMEYAGGVYHVMDRGDRLEAIYEDDRDREMFLHTLEQACERTRWCCGRRSESPVIWPV